MTAAVAPLNAQIEELMKLVGDLHVELETLRKHDNSTQKLAMEQAAFIKELMRRLEKAQHEISDSAAENSRLAARAMAVYSALEPFASKEELLPREGDAAVKYTHSADDYRRAAKAYRSCR